MTTYLSISIPSGVLSPLIAFSRSSRQRLLTSSPGDQIVFFFLTSLGILTWETGPTVCFRFLHHFPLFSYLLPCFVLRLLFSFRNKFLPCLDERLCHRYYFVVLAALPQVVDSHSDSRSDQWVNPPHWNWRTLTWLMWGWTDWSSVFPGCWGDPSPVSGLSLPGSFAPASSWWTEPHPRRTFCSGNNNKWKSSVPVMWCDVMWGEDICRTIKLNFLVKLRRHGLVSSSQGDHTVSFLRLSWTHIPYSSVNMEYRFLASQLNTTDQTNY